MTVAVGPVHITVSIVRAPVPQSMPPTVAERVHRRNAYVKAMETSRDRWISELSRWV
jgi:hypothetical protein